MIARFWSLFSLLILFPFMNLAEEKPIGEDGENPFDHLVCREVNYGGGHHQIHQRKFLVLSGLGGGIGNYLIFYPAAYYFAAVTGRDILILDNSLIGEMCNVVRCGFPLYSEAAAVYRTILPPNAEGVRTVKTADFMNHVWRGKLIEDRVIIASGFQQKSGWYGDNEFANQCLEKLTGCPLGDISCQDRFAYERLVMGPFHSQFRDPKLQSYYHIAGIPHNLRKGILSLPHALSPRIDAAVHIRCQFSNFEWGVGPEDESWKNYVKEVDDFLNSSAFNAGIQLFQHIEKKIVEQVVEIRKLRDESKRNRRNRRERRRLLGHHNPHNHSRSLGGRNSEKEEGGDEVVSFHKLTFDERIEKEEYHGDGEHDRIFVYISSDNDRVKEAFVKYLEDHDKIAVIRVKTDQIIYHAKNVNFLSQNASIGAFNLVMDWYALSLANVLFAWRRDTHIVSTFAQSAACYSGNSAEVIIETKNGTRSINRNKEYGLEKVRAFQLITKNSVAWKEF